MRWWQERCLEWCFARYENGKFGDQVYLDQWPTLFGDRVHIVRQVEKTLAPWNVRHFATQNRSRPDRSTLAPVFYHFHGLRVLANRRARLFKFYNVGSAGLAIYDQYLAVLGEAHAELDRAGIQTPTHTLPSERYGWVRTLGRLLKGTERFAKIPRAGNSPERSPSPPRHQEHQESGRGPARDELGRVG
jgi:hypothetical protein